MCRAKREVLEEIQPATSWTYSLWRYPTQIFIVHPFSRLGRFCFGGPRMLIYTIILLDKQGEGSFLQLTSTLSKEFN